MRASTMPCACLSVRPHVDQFTLSAFNAVFLVPAATPCNPSPKSASTQNLATHSLATHNLGATQRGPNVFVLFASGCRFEFCNKALNHVIFSLPSNLLELLFEPSHPALRNCAAPNPLLVPLAPRAGGQASRASLRCMGMTTSGLSR